MIDLLGVPQRNVPTRRVKFTDCQARYLAYELTRRCPSDSIEKVAAAVAGAQVNHQEETQRNEKCRSLFEAQDAIDLQREALIDKVEGKLSQKPSSRPCSRSDGP